MIFFDRTVLTDLGIDGLFSRTAPDAEPKLDKQQMAEMRQLVIDGPDRKIHKVIGWRCFDLRAEVARRYAVTVDEITIGPWLNQMGLTSSRVRSTLRKTSRHRRILKNVWPAPSASDICNLI